MKNRSISSSKYGASHPEPSGEQLAEAPAARGIQQKVFGARAAATSLKSRGRPKAPDSKVTISLRLPQETLDRWKASGHGWQTRMANLLRDAI